MAEKQTIRLIFSDEDVKEEDIKEEDVKEFEIDKDIYDRFAARAKELGMSWCELLIARIDASLKKEGY